MNLLQELKEKKNAIIVLAIIISMILTTVLVSSTVTAHAATSKYYDVKLGGKVVAVVKTQEDGNRIVNGVKNYYVKKGAEVKSVKVDPAIRVEEHSYDKAPKVAKDLNAVVDKLIKGDAAETDYTVKENDTLWDIANNMVVSVEKLAAMNPDKDMNSIMPGDVIKYQTVKPLVNVTVEQVVTSSKAIPHGTVTENDDSMYTDESKVKTEGVDGTQDVKEKIVSKNGEVTSTEELESKVTKKPVDEVVLQGTKERETVTEDTTEAESADNSAGSSASSRNYDAPTMNGSGAAIASYACQFVGNPYVYGGTSLTNGADCSGFVYAVYNACGYSIPRVGQNSIGRSVSLSNAQPGDIVCYSGHYALYIGGGQVVHAVNESYGIAITSVYLCGTPYDVRRVVE